MASWPDHPVHPNRCIGWAPRTCILTDETNRGVLIATPNGLGNTVSVFAPNLMTSLMVGAAAHVFWAKGSSWMKLTFADCRLNDSSCLGLWDTCPATSRAWIGHGLRAGVAQASREETADQGAAVFRRRGLWGFEQHGAMLDGHAVVIDEVAGLACSPTVAQGVPAQQLAQAAAALVWPATGVRAQPMQATG